MPLSIIGNTTTCTPWILENFIQLRCSKNSGNQQHLLDFVDVNMLYFPTPWLSIQRIDRIVFDRYIPDLRQFVISSLQDNYYVHLYVDEFFVPNRAPFGKEHIPHDILISGYDEQAREFEIAGFDEQGFYRQTTLSYQHFQQATSNSSLIFEEHNPLLLLQLQSNPHFEFSVTNIVRGLSAYLQAEPLCNHTTTAPEETLVYGIDIYAALSQNIQTGVQHHIALETRPFQILLERNQLMQQRLRYLQEYGYIQNVDGFILSYAELEKASQTVRNTLIKYHLTGLERLSQKMQEQLLAMQMNEQMLLKEILQELP